MTQPQEAVGGATNDDTVIAAEPSIEDRFAALADEPQEEEEPAGDAAPEADEPVIDEPEIEAEDIEALSPIEAPVSWPDEDKAAFADLPRALQERVTTREAEREKFVQAKSREASQTRQIVETQAVEVLQQVQQAQIQQLVALLPEVPEEPSAHLMVQDPAEYAAQLDYVRQMAAYRSHIEQQIGAISDQQKTVAQQHEQARMAASIEVLREHFPEYLDADKMPELQKSLRSIGSALGYSDDALSKADGHDILAMRTAMGWKDKADKYDALMAKQMERVRAAKDLPRVSRPGSAQPKGAVANQRYTADREAMRRGDKDAAARVFDRFI